MVGGRREGRNFCQCLGGLGLPARAQGGGRACESGREVGHTRKLHVSGCHTCVGVELSGLDIVTFWCRPSQRLTAQKATGDSSVMDARSMGVEVDEAKDVY